MLGLGEEQEEIRTTIKDLAAIGLNVLTLGQYLQPSSEYAVQLDMRASPRNLKIGERKHLH